VSWGTDDRAVVALFQGVLDDRDAPCCWNIALNSALQMTANRTLYDKRLQMPRHIVTIALVQPPTNL
jgi:hypothetical protein